MFVPLRALSRNKLWRISLNVINNTRNIMNLREILPKFESIAPVDAAEPWDNVGLLLEPSPPHMVKKLMLTNDLTDGVLSEAVAKKIDLIYSYHPPIFASLKRITQENWKQRIVATCFENKIAIYSPHTALDAAQGGVNDWLISPFLDSDGISNPITDRGLGRYVRRSNLLSLKESIDKVKFHLNLKYIRLATNQEPDDVTIATVAVCAGSGASILKDVNADLYVTGEMSHHEVSSVSNVTKI